ncbi:alpha/beta fold hydrolase [Oryzobacter telluris]|uniref:alpha/beta fold hydrolase n=1 Tax=Oryzobacter telluris TaxID=3149179 RepID=UPI00370DB9EB
MTAGPSSTDARPRAVLVHGAVTAGRETWQAQQELAGEFELLVPDRQGYGTDGPDRPDDPVADAETISDLLGDGAHLVGYSMGAMAAMLAAARRPASVRSLVLVEPPALDLVRGRADADEFVAGYEAVRAASPDAERFLRDFLVFFGADPAEVAQIPEPMPEDMRRAAVAQFTGAIPWEVPTPVAELAATRFPVVVVSGGHSEMFDAVCDVLADLLDADRAVIRGGGHGVQFTGAPFNTLLRETWTSDPGTHRRSRSTGAAPRE